MEEEFLLPEGLKEDKNFLYHLNSEQKVKY